MKERQVFVQGAIGSTYIADCVAKHQANHRIGAHNLFLGQVRGDLIDGRVVSSIEFSAYEDMAVKALDQIREDAFAKFDLICMHVYHSLGEVKTGEICFCVFVSTAHRPQVYEATEYVVNRIKAEVPIFGKERIGEEEFRWKKNQL